MTVRSVARRQSEELPYVRTVLDNGLRVVTQEMPHARSVSAALFVGVGSRHEDEPAAGLSHLLEHLVFKGTAGFPDPGPPLRALHEGTLVAMLRGRGEELAGDPVLRSPL